MLILTSTIVRPSTSFVQQKNSIPVFPRSTPCSPPPSSIAPRFASLQNNENSDNNDNQNRIETIYKTINQKLGRRDKKHFVESSTFVVTPLAAAMTSFWLYPQTSLWFHQTVTYLSDNKWEPVDGGQLQWSILLPALNGVVMTAISLLYANLISTTGTQLRNRQMMVHSSLTSEVEGLRGLLQLVHYYPDIPYDPKGPISKAHFAHHIRDYLQVLVEETDQAQQQRVDALQTASHPLSKYRDGLHALSMTTDNAGNSVHPNILERSYESLQQICTARAARVTAMQTKFPDLHYVTITALTVAILFIFLLETDRKVILFLDKFQIRAVWGLLVGTLTAIYCIGIDLAQPFLGTYTVPAEQLLDDREEWMQVIEAVGESSIVGGDAIQIQAPPQLPMQPTQTFDQVYSPPTTTTVEAVHESEYSQESTQTEYYKIQDNEDMALNTGSSSSEQEPAADGGMSLYEEYMRGRNQ